MLGRAIIGGLLGGLALYLIGFIFWGTPLAGLAFANAGEAEAAAVQLSIAQNLSASGTGTYVIPDPGTAGGSTLYGQGPIATVHFNSGGFPVVDSGSLVTGLVMALIVGVIIALALSAIGDRVTNFADRAKLVVLFALAITIWTWLGQPVFNHYGWGYFVYGFIADLIGLSAAGLIVARWFLPKAAYSPETA